MVKGEAMLSYLTKISQVRDELAAVGEVVSGSDLLWTTMNEVAKPWAVLWKL